ncbi:pyridinium-3,5-bisthiocarboxylic acid mononucleotide nickel chelatase, partial [Acinetobacter sp. 163]|nr:pyridinium-3,5-bisthiocarboxylic acid mononucleotide nickel chelatase [Acinetobacter sp. 163]
TTLGIRETLCQRHTLTRHVEQVETPWGQVRKKISTGQGIYREKYEYDDLARLAKEHGVSLQEVPLQK